MASMVLTGSRKRSRDDSDEADVDNQPFEKKSKASSAATLDPFRPNLTKQWHAPRLSAFSNKRDAESEDDSVPSNTSALGSTTDDSMDLDASGGGDQGSLTQLAPILRPDGIGTKIPTLTHSASQPETSTTGWPPPSGLSWPSSSWPTTSGAEPPPHDQRTPRKSDSHLTRPVRPKPYPLQSTSSHGQRALGRSNSLHNRMSSSAISPTTTVPRSTALPSLTSAASSVDGGARPPPPSSASPSMTLDDDDEPHTPSTAAGRFGLLSVNDMDVDPIAGGALAAAVTTPLSAGSGTMALDTDSIAGGFGMGMGLGLGAGANLGLDVGLGFGRTPSTSSFARKQRQRSGAFISRSSSPVASAAAAAAAAGTPDAVANGGGAGSSSSSSSSSSRRFLMGYRDDCAKCRDRVPGHMNHFIGAST